MSGILGAALPLNSVAARSLGMIAHVGAHGAANVSAEARVGSAVSAEITPLAGVATLFVTSDGGLLEVGLF